MPLLEDVGVIALVPDRWDDVWQPRHQTMARLARYFHVAWVDPQPHWRSFRQPAPDPTYYIEPPENLRVYEARRRYARTSRLRRWNRLAESSRLRLARRHLKRMGCRKFVLYVWRPKFAGALDLVAHDVSCYHVDDEYSFSSVEEPLSSQERRLLERVDRAFIHSPALMEKKGWINPNTLHTPNGVDYRAYSTPAHEPADLAPVARPRVLCSGRLKRQMDWHLLVEVVRREPSWQFVFVGPVLPHAEVGPLVDDLASRANVHFLGGKNPRELPAYVQHSDVCVMPYVVDGYTKFIYPLKLHEYLAAGKPVVSSAIQSVQPFTHVVDVARGAEQWHLAVASALSKDPGTLQAEAALRQKVARSHDWNELVAGIARSIGEALGPTYVARLHGVGSGAGGL